MAQRFDYDLVAIGSGPAGQRAAIQAAKLGKRSAVVERRRIVGGVCLDTGTIPSKTLREAVLAFAAADSGALDRRRIRRMRQRPTAEQLLARVDDVIAIESELVEDKLRRNDVELIRGIASFDDPHTITVDTGEGTRTLTTDKVVIAVGTRPLPPPGCADAEDLVIDSDGVGQLGELPRRMVVVGAGVIGIEYASMFAQLRIEVTLVEKQRRPLGFVDHEIVDELIHQMRNNNVSFRLGEAVDRLEVLEGPPRRVALYLESGKKIVSDLVLFSAGRQAATEGLHLERTGIEVDPRGRLEVDEAFKTKTPNIYAAGDVIGYPSLAATSMEQGRLAACHAFGIEAGPMAPHFPIGIYAVPEISMVGLTEEEATEKRIPYDIGVARYREIARGQILGDDSGYFKMLFHRDTHELLGVHAIGTGATELIHIGQAVLGLGAGLDYFLRTVFNYPTLAECYKVAALDAANKLGLTGRSACTATDEVLRIEP